MKVAKTLCSVLLLLIVCSNNIVFAHYPHDEIEFITLSPNFGTDETAFVTQKQGSSVRPHVSLVTRDAGTTWEYNPAGMNNTSRFTSAAISPFFATDRQVYMTSQSDGVFYSSDAGLTWSQINQGLPTLGLKDSAAAIGASNAVHLYVSGSFGGLYRTTDSGATWQTVLGTGVRAEVLEISPNYTVDGTVLVGDATGAIFMSSDGGASFVQLNALQSVGGIASIGFSPDYANSGEIIVGTTAGLYRSVDSGQTYIQLQGFVSDVVYALSVSPNYIIDGTIFAATADSVYRSTDAGLSWSLTATGIQLVSQSFVHFFDLQMSENFADDGVVYLAAFEGLHVSTDGGISWDELDPRPATLVMGVAMSPNYAQDGLTLVSTYGGGLYITEDAGANWRVSNTGVSNTYTYQVAIRQGTGSIPVLIASQQNHVLISTNLGASWTRRTISGALPGICIPSAMDVSRTFASDFSIVFGCRKNGIVMSEDAGNSWQLLLSAAQLNGGSVTSVEFSPNYAVDSTIFFADTRGVFGRTDSKGNPWNLITVGLPTANNWFGGTAITLSDNFATDGIAIAATPEGFYASNNRGNSWFAMPDVSSPVVTGIIESAAVSPDLANDHMALASVRGQGLFRSIDGGLSWLGVGSGLLDENNELKYFEFSPNFALDGEIVGFGHDRILRSTDRGLTFQAMDLPFIRHEDERTQSVGFSGSWTKVAYEQASGTTMQASQTVGDETTLTFVGTGIRWIGVKANILGIAEVYLDDVLVTSVDQYYPGVLWQEELFSVQDLTPGLHQVRVRVSSGQNENSLGNWTFLDAFDVTH